MSEQNIDAQFAEMGEDEQYQAESLKIAREFHGSENIKELRSRVAHLETENSDAWRAAADAEAEVLRLRQQLATAREIFLNADFGHDETCRVIARAVHPCNCGYAALEAALGSTV